MESSDPILLTPSLRALSERPGNPSRFKLDLIDKIPEGEEISCFQNGEFMLRGSLAAHSEQRGPQHLSKSKLTCAPTSSKLSFVTTYPLKGATALMFRTFTPALDHLRTGYVALNFKKIRHARTTKSRTYEYPSGAINHNGDGTTTKLDTTYPYGLDYPTNGSQPSDISTGDTPGDPLVGSIFVALPANNPSTARSKITVDETVNTFIMFKPAGTASCSVSLRRATWMWGGSVVATDNWTAVTGSKSPGSALQGAEWMDHPRWTQNAKDDHEIAGP